MTLSADNNTETLANLSEAVHLAFPDAQVLPFQDELLAGQYISNNPVDFLFARVDNRRMSGFDILRFVRRVDNAPNTVLVADSQELRDDAIRADAFGFLPRPITAGRYAS